MEKDRNGFTNYEVPFGILSERQSQIHSAKNYFPMGRYLDSVKMLRASFTFMTC
jgi:hypothetical protein